MASVLSAPKERRRRPTRRAGAAAVAVAVMDAATLAPAVRPVDVQTAAAACDVFSRGAGATGRLAAAVGAVERARDGAPAEEVGLAAEVGPATEVDPAADASAADPVVVVAARAAVVPTVAVVPAAAVGALPAVGWIVALAGVSELAEMESAVDACATTGRDAAAAAAPGPAWGAWARDDGEVVGAGVRTALASTCAARPARLRRIAACC